MNLIQILLEKENRKIEDLNIFVSKCEQEGGVYAIIDEVGNLYIGSTKSFRNRKTENISIKASIHAIKEYKKAFETVNSVDNKRIKQFILNDD